MSGHGIPYRLRPNKFVDREMFAEFVSVLVSGAGPDEYVYVSMGGNHLSDHVAIYRRSGLKNLYAFDYDPNVVARQKFNAPFEGVRCEVHASGELPIHLDEILAGFKAKNAVIWVDYTETKHLTQLREIESLASKLIVGDVLRVTMNVDFLHLDKLETQLRSEEKELPDREKRVALLKRDLGSYLSASIKRLDRTDLPGALANSIARACRLGCETGGAGTSPVPVLITEYRDTTKMLSATVMIADDGDPQSVIPQAWRFAPDNWDGIQKIEAPDLSPRERYALDKIMHESPDKISKILGFPVPEAAATAYFNYHRFYPSFQSVND